LHARGSSAASAAMAPEEVRDSKVLAAAKAAVFN